MNNTYIPSRRQASIRSVNILKLSSPSFLNSCFQINGFPNNNNAVLSNQQLNTENKVMLRGNSLTQLKLKTLKKSFSPCKVQNIRNNVSNMASNYLNQLSKNSEHRNSFFIVKTANCAVRNKLQKAESKKLEPIININIINTSMNHQTDEQYEQINKTINDQQIDKIINIVNNEIKPKKLPQIETKLPPVNLKNDSNIMKKQVSGPYLGIDDQEKLKIRIYFRSRMASFVKIVDERLKKYMAMNKSPEKITKNKYPSVKDLSQGQNNLSMINNRNTDSSNLNFFVVNSIIDSQIEYQLKDDIWKTLKRIASTKSKYKFRDIINFDKKLQQTRKTLAHAKSPKILKSLTKALLNDEDDETPVKKKSSKKAINNNNTSNDEITNNDPNIKSIIKADPNAKIYIIVGGYTDLRKAFDDRGWIENPDTSSKIFNLKWTLKKVDLNFFDLMPHQLVNHFEKNTSITTKVGLARNIRNLIWFNDDDIDYFYPRCFDLNDISDFDDFIEDFKFTEAQAILKNLDKLRLPNEINLDLLKLKIVVSIDICERFTKDHDALLAFMFDQESIAVTQIEWDIMTAPNIELILNNPKKFEKDLKKLMTKHNITLGDLTQSSNIFEPHLYTKVESILKDIEKLHPQHSLNGISNIWIIKPASLSRGRGISCYSNLHDILDHIKVKESEWVAQKYIENPLIIFNKKFDIRQWVLVTDWNPLTIWFYEECYIRFSAENYDPNNLRNRFCHLTNNSIAKHCQNFDNSEIEGNMWTCMEFAEYLKSKTNQDEFYQKIQPKMKQTVIKSLQCVQDMVENRKNSFELYGYDFMIDEKLQPWLIEINSSPAMDYSTVNSKTFNDQIFTQYLIIDSN